MSETIRSLVRRSLLTHTHSAAAAAAVYLSVSMSCIIVFSLVYDVVWRPPRYLAPQRHRELRT